MKFSTDRIVTTPVDSMPRPSTVWAGFEALAEGARIASGRLSA